MRIGFIGLGHMGTPMAQNLVAAGHEVRGFDISGAVPDGVARAEGATDAARGADAVITMLTTGSLVRTVYGMAVPAASPGALFLDCSAIDVASARAAAALATGAGLVAVDAPCSGGTAAAAAGTLTFMAGGTPEGFERARPLLDILGSRAIYCGAAGSGQIGQDLQQPDPRRLDGRRSARPSRWPASSGSTRTRSTTWSRPRRATAGR